MSAPWCAQSSRPDAENVGQTVTWASWLMVGGCHDAANGVLLDLNLRTNRTNSAHDEEHAPAMSAASPPKATLASPPHGPKSGAK